MAKIKSVLLYSDASTFGGHEAMTLEVVRCLSQNDDLAVTVLFYEQNVRLRNELEKIANSTRSLSLVPTRFKAKSLQAFRSLASIRKIRHLKTLMKHINPEVVVISQGRIEGGSLGLLAAKRAGFRTISYIPMAHSVRVSGAPFALRLREMVNAYLYRLPDKFVTISDSARTMLLERSETASVAVVPNSITVKPTAASERHLFREKHGIGPGEYLVGVIGRIEFRQKGQDFALESVSRFRQQLEGYKVIFVGDGPDEQKLSALIADSSLSDMVQLLPWRDDPASIYAGLDMLLIPSRFEGVPLVMLEAMAHKLPIVASDQDGMAELLPKHWLFPFGDYRALAERMLQVRVGDNRDLLEKHKSEISEKFTSTKFCDRISAALID